MHACAYVRERERERDCVRACVRACVCVRVTDKTFVQQVEEVNHQLDQITGFDLKCPIDFKSSFMTIILA